MHNCTGENSLKTDCDIAIIGTGPAALIAAIAAQHARHSIRVCMIERNAQPAVKLRVTGGGRCNITNRNVALANYHTHAPKRVEQVLRGFSHEDTVRWFEANELPLAEEENGKLFPQCRQAKAVAQMLLDRLAPDTSMKLQTEVRELSPTADGTWRIKCDGAVRNIVAGAVIVASGGCAMPRSGSDGTLADVLIEKLQIPACPSTPALCPLTLRKEGELRNFSRLSGVTINGRLTLSRRGDRKQLAQSCGSILFTHTGLSGPAVLNISGAVLQSLVADDECVLTLAHPEFRTREDAYRFLVQARQASPLKQLGTVLAPLWPERLMLQLAHRFGAITMSHLTKEQMSTVARNLAQCEIFPSSRFEWDTCEVSGGGIDLQHVHPKTLESRSRRGLYFCGEILDVVGDVGGYNLQWAWSSGFVAGRAAANAVRNEE